MLSVTIGIYSSNDHFLVRTLFLIAVWNKNPFTIPKVGESKKLKKLYRIKRSVNKQKKGHN